MTRMAEDAIIPCHTPPEIVEDFFCYDRFRILWRDFCDGTQKNWYHPQLAGSFCGIRNLSGPIGDGRTGYVNLAFLTETAGDITALRRIALSILGDMQRFTEMMLSLIRIGGECSYEIDCEGFRAWMDRCTGASRMKLMIPPNDPVIPILKKMNRKTPPVLETDLFRFAVLSSDWKTVCGGLGSSLLWRVKPAAALTPEVFAEQFLHRSPLWTLYTPADTQTNPPDAMDGNTTGNMIER